MPQKIHLLISLSDKSTESFSLDKESITLGRSPENDIQVLVSEISTKHCQFFRTDDGYEIQDLDSTNGTKVNGSSVGNGRIAVKDNDIVLLGETTPAYVVEAEDVAELDFVEKIKEIKDNAAAPIAAAVPVAAVAPAAQPVAPIAVPAPAAPLTPPAPAAPLTPPAPAAPLAPPAPSAPLTPPAPLASPPPTAVPTVKKLSPPTGATPPPVAPGPPSAAAIPPPAAPLPPPSSGDKTVALSDVAAAVPKSGPLPVPKPVGGTPPPAFKMPSPQPVKKLAVPPPSPPKP